jgi:hypothetical protein
MRHNPKFNRANAKLGGYFVTLKKEMNPELVGGWMLP